MNKEEAIENRDYARETLAEIKEKLMKDSENVDLLVTQAYFRGQLAAYNVMLDPWEQK